jgi:beta-apo-4'-carotenal oxygenase
MTSGGATLNDSFFHGSVGTVPFGGVGDSGMGQAHGKAAFDSFTHQRTVAETPGWAEVILRVRYMPYDWGQLRFLQRMTGKKPNFDRNGHVVKGLGYWLAFLAGLGASGAKGALLRWIVLLASGYWYQSRRA